MAVARHRQPYRRNSFEGNIEIESNLARYETSIALDKVEGNNSAATSPQPSITAATSCSAIHDYSVTNDTKAKNRLSVDAHNFEYMVSFLFFYINI